MKAEEVGQQRDSTTAQLLHKGEQSGRRSCGRWVCCASRVLVGFLLNDVPDIKPYASPPPFQGCSDEAYQAALNFCPQTGTRHVHALAKPKVIKQSKMMRTKQKVIKQKNSDDAMLETNTSCLTGKQLANMTAEQRVAVNAKLNATLKKQINKTVKAAVISVRFKEVAEDKFLETLTNARRSAWSMVHKARPTLWEQYSVLARVKVGDWVKVGD